MCAGCRWPLRLPDQVTGPERLRGAPGSLLWAHPSLRQAGTTTPAAFFPRYHISLSFIPHMRRPDILRDQAGILASIFDLELKLKKNSNG